MSKSQMWGFRILRIGMALVFIWFGTQQLINTEMWTKIVPEWIVNLSFVTATQVVLINGLFEILAALLLIFNLFTRTIAVLLGLHLIGIASTFGLSPTGIRDFGLAIAMFSVALLRR